MSVRINRNRPLLALLAIEALSSDSRRAILGQLLRVKEGLPASVLAKSLGLTLPTILSHLDKLVASGLVKVVPSKRGGKPVKLYRAAGRRLVLEVDLSTLAAIPPRERLQGMLAEVVGKLRERGRLPERLDPYTAQEVLGLETEEALVVADYYNMSRDAIVEMLIEEALEAFKGRDEVELGEIEEALKLTTYWAVKVANRLEELGIVSVKY